MERVVYADDVDRLQCYILEQNGFQVEIRVRMGNSRCILKKTCQKPHTFAKRQADLETSCCTLSWRRSMEHSYLLANVDKATKNPNR